MFSRDQDSGDDVVISGIAGVFPNSNNVRNFEENLRLKVDMTSDDDRRWAPDGTRIPHRFGKLNEINKFDANFFNILSNAADVMDPMARILLEKTYEAIIDAGYNPQEVKGTKTGVFVGVSYSDTESSNFCNQTLPSYVNMFGCNRSLLANRISYWLDARGPSYAVDSACSASIHALEHAYRAIKSGICESVIVGGSNICLHKAISNVYHQLGTLSPDGRCKSFDESANGFTRAEAVAVLFLQKRQNARRVYARVVHAKTNCDGNKGEGFHHPSVTVQTDLLQEFYKECQVDPEQLEYFEAHATGTKIGDCVEMSALETAIVSRRSKPLKIGCVKSNMGHAEPVSGICGIIKIILSYESGYIMPNINLKKPRSDINGLREGSLKVVTELIKWNGGLSSVNNFGIGGANGHVLLDSNHKTKINNGLPDDNLPRLVLVSGRTEDAVDVMLKDLEGRPLDAEYVGLFHEIYKTPIPGHSFRGFTILEKQRVEKIRSIQVCPTEKRPIWYVYSGIGSQWLTMGKSLIKIPVIKESIEKCHKILADKGVDLINILTSPDQVTFNNALNSYCGIVAIQIALTDLLTFLGIIPDGIIGHSVGEMSCAYADGSLTLEEAILLAYYRGLASLESNGIHGLMAAVGLGEKDLNKILPSSVDIACHNGPDSCTISGPYEEVESFIEKLGHKDIFARKVESSNMAFHSRYIDDMGTSFYDKAEIILSDPKLRSERWLSSTYPKAEWQSEASKYASAKYFAKNIVGTVYFEEVSNYVPKNATVIEIAPHGSLQAILKRSLSKEVINIPLTHKNHPENAVHLLTAIGKIYEAGGMPQISKLYPPIQFPVSKGTPSISSLVRWDHQQDWFVFNDKNMSGIKGLSTVSVSLKDSQHNYLAGHVIRGKVLYPASGYLVLAWETFSAMIGKPMNQVSVKITDVKYLRFTTISESSTTQFHISIFKNTGDFEILEGGDLVVKGKIFAENSDTAEDSIIAEDVDYMLSNQDFYTIKELLGFNYKGQFRSVTRSNYERTVAQVSWHNNYVSFLDCLFQIMVNIDEVEQKGTRIPVSLKTLIIHPLKHERILQKLDTKNPEFTLFHCLETNEVSCGGIRAVNCETALFSASNTSQKCMLEKIDFLPSSHSKLSVLSHAVRVITQIVVENCGSKEIKVVEIVDENAVEKSLISPIFDEAIDCLPLVKAEIILQVNEQNGFVTQDRKTRFHIQKHALSNDTSCHLIITSEPCKDKQILTQYVNSLQEEGFILTREDSFEESLLDQVGLAICFQCKLNENNLILLRKKPQVRYEILTLKISNDHYEWISTLQNLLQRMTSSQKLILFAEKEPINGILGLYHCVAIENPDRNICCFVIMDLDVPSFEPRLEFYRNQIKRNLRVNVYKDGAWGTYRNLPLSEDRRISSQKFLSLSVYGDLSTIQWFEGSLDPIKYTPPDDKKQLVSVQCAALNFRDIMIASGKLDPSSIFRHRSEKDCMIGMEFAGYLADGRRVMGIMDSKAISDFVEIDKEKLISVPDEWTLEEAVTIPVVYGTVMYSLLSCGPLRRGSSILIHCGAGGLGIAAINVCLHYGCEIFTTVGTPEKRNFIKSQFPSISENHIGNSRDCSFEKMIKTVTKGTGVDLVLNSLAEDKLEASIRCLKSGGRFIEVGKYDMIMNHSLDLRPFLKGIMFHTVDLTNITRDPNTWKELKSLMENAIRQRVIKPLPSIMFKADEAEKAFRFMASGKHVGKVVLKIHEDCRKFDTLPLTMKCQARFNCSSEKSYILCGAMGGIGMELAGWLVDRGAHKLILASRRGFKTGYQRFYTRKWQLRNVNVTISCGDISDKVYVKQLLEFANSIGPVAAIFNLATVLSDKMFMNQTAEDFRITAEPKVQGTSHLDELSRKLCPELEHFVVYSSVACLGAPGQSNYAMANSAIERICELRRADQLPALAIELGPVGNVGIFMKMVKKLGDDRVISTAQNGLTTNEQLELTEKSLASYEGYELQYIESVLAVHDQFLRQNNPLVLSRVLAEKNSTIRNGSLSLLETIANILGIKQVESVDANATLRQLGMDSMVNSEIREILRKEWDVVLTLQEVANLTFSKIKQLKASSPAEN